MTRQWVVYRFQTHRMVFTGIEAESREDAIAAFYRGEGDMQTDREFWSEWELALLQATAPAVANPSPSPESGAGVQR